MKSRALLTASISALAFLSGCATHLVPNTITETTAARPELSTLTQLINDAGLTQTFQGPGPFTVFAPTNDAFKAVPAQTMEALGKDKALLGSVLKYHVIAGRLLSADVKNGPTNTLHGAPVALFKSGTFLTVEEAVVTSPDIAASNGVVHIVDRVLLPPKK